jgi:hypothetical protein
MSAMTLAASLTKHLSESCRPAGATCIITCMLPLRKHWSVNHCVLMCGFTPACSHVVQKRESGGVLAATLASLMGGGQKSKAGAAGQSAAAGTKVMHEVVQMLQPSVWPL